MTAEDRYLPLLDENGNWALERPDLYMLVRLALPDDQGQEDFEQAYQLIVSATGDTEGPLNGPQALLEQHYVSANKSERLYTEMVLTELFRLDVSKEKITLNKALKLIVPEVKRKKPTTEDSSIKHQAKRAFKRFRSTCHLQLAFQVGVEKFGEIFEDEHALFERFLKRAKAYEILMDKVCAKSALTWQPWRVPRQITAEIDQWPSPLTDEEIQLLRST